MLLKALGPGQVPGLRPAREAREAPREEGGVREASQQVPSQLASQQEPWLWPARERKQKAQQKAPSQVQALAPVPALAPAPVHAPV